MYSARIYTVPRPRKWKTAAFWLVVGILLLGVLRHCSPPDPTFLDVGCGKKQPRLELAFYPRLWPPLTINPFAQQPRSVEIRSLNDLRGKVQIDSRTCALRYVRLRTSPVTCFFWPEPQLVEIIPHRELSNMPTYGVSVDPDPDLERSGYMGVLSDAAWSEGHFQPATVRRTERGYEVVRWLIQDDWGPQAQVLKVQETVGTDGSYAMQVLCRGKAPLLPGTHWQFPQRRD